jgi:hypothetical protein
MGQASGFAGAPFLVFANDLWLDWSRDWRRGSRSTLLHGWRWWNGVADALDAFFEALQSLAQSFAQLRQPLGAEQQECNYAQHNQVPWLKEIAHLFILRAPRSADAQSQWILSHKGECPRRTGSDCA